MLRQADKNGISEIVSYVLLVMIVLGMSVAVYSYLKSYVPKERSECPDGVSLSVREYDCYIANNENALNITFQNNGLFTVHGYTLYASDDLSNKIATSNLRQIVDGSVVNDPTPPEFISLSGTQGIAPNAEVTHQFSYQTYKSELLNNVAFIEITPFVLDSKGNSSICGNTRIKEEIRC